METEREKESLANTTPELREKLHRRLERIHGAENERGIAGSNVHAGIQTNPGRACCISLNGPESDHEELARSAQSDESDSDSEPLEYMMLAVASKLPVDEAAVLLRKIQRSQQRQLCRDRLPKDSQLTACSKDSNSSCSSAMSKPEGSDICSSAVSNLTHGLKAATEALGHQQMKEELYLYPGWQRLKLLGVACLIAVVATTFNLWRQGWWADSPFNLTPNANDLIAVADAAVHAANVAAHAACAAAMASKGAMPVAEICSQESGQLVSGVYKSMPLDRSPLPAPHVQKSGSVTFSDPESRARTRALGLALEQAAQEKMRRATEKAAERLVAIEAQRAASSPHIALDSQEVSWRRARLHETVEAMES